MRQIKIGAFIHHVGHHVAAWRLPEVPAFGAMQIAHYADMARKAEKARYDMVFIGDSLATWESGPEPDSHMSGHAFLEPAALVAALAVQTSNIGIAATITTTYNEPYNVARRLASLDHISGGRIAWNLVTSSNAAEGTNFNRDGHVPHEDRYARAEEFYEVTRKLWDSFEDDAFRLDKDSGRFFDPRKWHTPHHSGAHFKVRGPLTVARPLQGRPVIAQAGQSGPGMALASRVGEVIFTLQQTKEAAKAFREKIRSMAAAHGRNPDHVLVMPGIVPVAGRTERLAQDTFRQLQSLVLPEVGLALLSQMLGADLSGCDVDGPVPEDLPPNEGFKSRREVLLAQARRDNLSIRQLYELNAPARGHQAMVGSGGQIADILEEWHADGAADGFMLLPTHLPGGLEDFSRHVLPELRRRGLFRTEYEGPMLRDILGLPRPAHGAA